MIQNNKLYSIVLALALSVFFITLSSVCSGQISKKEELKRMEQALTKSILNSDSTAIESILATTFFIISPDNKVISRYSATENYKQIHYSLYKQKIGSISIIKNVAEVKGSFTIINNWEKPTGHKIKNPDANISGKVKFINTWELVGQVWLLKEQHFFAY